LHSLWISFFKVSTCFFCIRNGLHCMVVLLLSVGVRPGYSPSHPVFHRTAPQILVGASAMCPFLLH
jgi:hypothetical protein